MSSPQRKKKIYYEVYPFTNVSGAPLTLEAYSHENTTSFVVKKVAHENVSRRVVCFLSLLVFYVVGVILGFIGGWCSCLVLIVGIIGLLETMSRVVQESLLIVENLGLQIDIKYVVGSKSAFIPNDIIKDLFINEVISRHRVIYLLSVLTKDTHKSKTIIPLFQETLPRLDCIQIIYRAFKSAKCSEKPK